MLKILKLILFGSFWSFLLVVSGIVDIGIGCCILSGIISVEGSALTIFLICLGIGLIYLAGGFAIAMVKNRSQKD